MNIDVDITTLIGLSGAFFSTIAYFPQVVKTWQTKSAEDMSWAMLIALCMGIVLWLVYGLKLHNMPLIAANIVTLTFTTTILGLKFAYSSKQDGKIGWRRKRVG
ncbi:MAG: SemiSWEET family sugar transporter [Cyanophyceae cyanobacterium]